MKNIIVSGEDNNAAARAYINLCIDRGIEWLIQHREDWLSEICDTTLNMQDCGQCILGQIYGDFLDVYYYPNRGPNERAAVQLNDTEVATYGFDIPEDEDDIEKLDLGSSAAYYRILTQEWQKRIAMLRKERALQGVL